MTAGTQVYEFDVDNLQTDIVIKENEITGTLKHASGFNGFSNKTEEREGNFLALSLNANEGVKITTQLMNGTNKKPITVNDGFCVYRVTNKDTQSVKVTFTKGDTTETKIYGLSGLTCENE